MFDKKIVTITSLIVSEVNSTPNLHKPTAFADRKGGIVDGQEKEKSCQEKSCQEKKALAH
jgi:hypothetical protein